jgi:hypothetical protein
MAEAASRSYASVFCIERKPNAGSFVLKNKCGAWAESLATRQLWQAEQKGSAQGEESVLLWPERSSRSRTIPNCGPSENVDERTDRFPAGLRRLFWLTNGSRGRFWMQKLGREALRGRRLQRKRAFSVSSAPIHQKVGRACMLRRGVPLKRMYL